MHLVLGLPNELFKKSLYHLIHHKNVFYTFIEKSPVTLWEKNIKISEKNSQTKCICPRVAQRTF